MLHLKLKMEKKKLANSKISKFCQPQKQNEDHTLLSESVHFDDDVASNLKEEEKLENLAALLNENVTEYSNKRFIRQTDKLDMKNLDSEFDIFLDGLILDDTRSKETQNCQSSKTFSLSPRRPLKNHEKSNFSRFFHHRNSSPTLNPTNSSTSTIAAPQPIASSSSLSINDFLSLQPTSCLDNKQKTPNYNSSFMSEYRHKYRENIRRNRSFKLIDSDLIIEENESPPNRILSANTVSPGDNRMPQNNKTKVKLRPNTSSVQDLLEHLNLNKTKSDGYSETSSSYGQQQNTMKLSKRWNPPPKLLPPSGFENKLFIDKEHTYPAISGGAVGSLNTGSSSMCDHKKRSPDLANSDNFENSFRVFKMTSDCEYYFIIYTLKFYFESDFV